jgi:hypothetical protein
MNTGESLLGLGGGVGVGNRFLALTGHRQLLISRKPGKPEPPGELGAYLGLYWNNLVITLGWLLILLLIILLL